jgi:hypothetical protein
VPEVAGLIPPGELNSLLVDGVIAGVGAVIVFLPQILLLFLFIGFLETQVIWQGQAFLMDRLMSKVGLHGKSFIPMLSSFACAIPGIMATRNHRNSQGSAGDNPGVAADELLGQASSVHLVDRRLHPQRDRPGLSEAHRVNHVVDVPLGHRRRAP